MPGILEHFAVSESVERVTYFMTVVNDEDTN